MTPTLSRFSDFTAYPHAAFIDPEAISTPLLAYEDDYDDDDLEDFDDFDDEDFDDEDDFDYDDDDYDEDDENY